MFWNIHSLFASSEKVFAWDRQPRKSNIRPVRSFHNSPLNAPPYGRSTDSIILCQQGNSSLAADCSSHYAVTFAMLTSKVGVPKQADPHNIIDVFSCVLISFTHYPQ
jgi:hypothetical protein